MPNIKTNHVLTIDFSYSTSALHALQTAL